MSAHARIAAITNRIVERSKPTRERYLERLRAAASKGVNRSVLGCANLAHHPANSRYAGVPCLARIMNDGSA